MQTILITGGNFRNKGAESMLIATVSGIREHFPDYEPVLLDLFPSLDDIQKKQYDFRILNMHVRSLFRIAFPVLKLFFKHKLISDDEQEIKNSFATASAVFDISGYGLSSHNQSLVWNVAYLIPFLLARKNNVSVWLLPQSIGPFDFKGLKKLLFNIFGKALLNYPEVVFVREPSGLLELNKVRNKRSLFSNDIVLQTKTDFNNEIINGDEVVVIPNKQLFNITDPKIVVDIYSEIINQFLERKIPVRVIRHSYDDYDFCVRIAKLISHNLLTVSLSNMPLKSIIDIVGKSRFVVSGRYHGAIHALKSGKPLIILGWAEKYRHLASLFQIEDLFIDIRDQHLKTNTSDMIDYIISEEVDLKTRISGKHIEIQQNNFWSQIKLNR